jgi:O-antigen chain-terminating methyltransferase
MINSGSNEAQIQRIKSLLDLAENYVQSVDPSSGQTSTITSLLIQALKESLTLNRQLSAQFTELQSQLNSSSGVGSTLNNPTDSHVLDHFYAAFEDRFRGSRESIFQKLQVYLPLLELIKTSGLDPLVLDLGCGRGEWLELLQSAGYQAIGIDTNSFFLSQCRDKNLSVIEADVMEYLPSLPSSSVGAVTGFHIVEHLPFNSLIQLLHEILRILQPGGLAIFETPNPENLRVGACGFWSDPTHIRPIFPHTLKFLLEQWGFVEVQLFYMNEHVLQNPLHGITTSSQTVDLLDPVVEQVNILIALMQQNLYAAPDFSVVGRKR